MQLAVQRMADQRRTILLGFLIGFSCWLGARLVRQLIVPDEPSASVLVAVELAGWLIWMFSLVRVVVFGRRVPSAVRGALNDELTTRRRETALAIGFVAVMLAQPLVIAATGANPGIASQGRFAAEFTIFVGVLATIGSYLYLDRE